jgi:formate dehydrogenase assembly factor FdhD
MLPILDVEALVGLLGSGRSTVEYTMKAFCVAVVVAIALSATAATALSFAQETVAQAYSHGSARLDQEESVNLYGR